jgi:hypothetical protein
MNRCMWPLSLEGCEVQRAGVDATADSSLRLGHRRRRRAPRRPTSSDAPQEGRVRVGGCGQQARARVHRDTIDGEHLLQAPGPCRRASSQFRMTSTAVT